MTSGQKTCIDIEDRSQLRNSWLSFDREFRILVVKDICAKTFNQQQTIETQDLQTRLPNGYVVVNRVESDPYEIRRAFYHLVSGFAIPQDYGVSTSHLHGMYKSFIEKKKKGMPIDIVAFLRNQKPTRCSI